MSNLSPLHVSYSAKHGDGGIAFAVADLLAAQQRAGVYSRWLTADQYNPWNRDQKLYEEDVVRIDMLSKESYTSWLPEDGET